MIIQRIRVSKKYKRAISSFKPHNNDCEIKSLIYASMIFVSSTKHHYYSIIVMVTILHVLTFVQNRENYIHTISIQMVMLQSNGIFYSYDTKHWNYIIRYVLYTSMYLYTYAHQNCSYATCHIWISISGTYRIEQSETRNHM